VLNVARNLQYLSHARILPNFALELAKAMLTHTNSEARIILIGKAVPSTKYASGVEMNILSSKRRLRSLASALQYAVSLGLRAIK